MSNTAFWDAKLQRNVERDRDALSALSAAGWSVLIIWECETRRPALLVSRIELFLS